MHGLRPIADTDGEHAANTDGLCAIEHRGKLAGLGVEIEMCVRIDQHGLAEPGAKCDLFAEGGKHRLTISPPCEAASNIPCDSRPRILRGARLAITTIFRPTNSSGVYHSAMPESICRLS